MGIKIADKEFSSRLMIGSGKYSSYEIMEQALKASGADIITVAIRRVDMKAPGHENILGHIDTSKYWILPNTAACATVEKA